MAQHAGVTDAHAAYGAAQQQDAYALLRRVSHWPQDDVEREKTLLNDATIIPTYRLARFDQLLKKIEFQSFEGHHRRANPKRTGLKTATRSTMPTTTSKNCACKSPM